VNIPKVDKCHETLSGDSKSVSGSIACSTSHSIVSSGPNTHQNGISHILCPAVATRTIGSEQMVNSCGMYNLRGSPPSHESSQNRVPSLSPIVGDIPNGYTSDVVLNQQARVAHQGWYGGFAIPGGPVAEVATAVLDAGAYGGFLDMSMADPKTGPWRTTDGKPMVDPETAHGMLPCSTRIGLSLGLQVVSAPVPTCSPRQAPL
jgi:hypothetical protein